MDPLAKALPYPLPRDTQDALYRLADIMRIPYALVRGDNGNACVNKVWLLGTMAGVILFRHLPRPAREQINRRVNALLVPKGSGRQNALFLALHGSILNILVTPDWGVWSMSNSELQEALKSDARFHYWLDVIDQASKVFSGASGAWGIARHSTTAVPAILIGMIIAGAHKTLTTELDYADAKYKRELAHRQKLMSSKYYR